jgi:hypothetical protein
MDPVARNVNSLLVEHEDLQIIKSNTFLSSRNIAGLQYMKDSRQKIAMTKVKTNGIPSAAS